MYYFEQSILIILLVFCLDITFCEDDVILKDTKSIFLRRKLDSDMTYPDLGDADPYTFTVLLFIYFRDGQQKTCTGTVIHDHAVITAARCFFLNFKLSTSADLELSMSFVVIGNRRQYLAGYESYLPMERVLIHPNFKGIDSTADIALVYTYMGLLTDKGGTKVSLVRKTWNKSFTIVTWSPVKVRPQDTEENARVCTDDGKRSFGGSAKIKSEHDAPSIYLSQLGDKYKREVLPHIKNRRAAAMEPLALNKTEAEKLEDLLKTFRNNTRRAQEDFTIETSDGKRALYVNEFTVISNNECKAKAEEEGKNVTFAHNTCFSTYQDVMEKDDAGAPAISEGQLVSIALGTLDMDGVKRHLSYGINLACYCQWIVVNLPKIKNKPDLQPCCSACCDTTGIKDLGLPPYYSPGPPGEAEVNPGIPNLGFNPEFVSKAATIPGDVLIFSEPLDEPNIVF